MKCPACDGAGKIGGERFSLNGMFYLMLVKKEIDFNEISQIYVEYLETKREDNLDQIIELSTLAQIFKDPEKFKIKNGDLDKRFAKAMIKTGFFRGTEYEEELNKMLGGEE